MKLMRKLEKQALARAAKEARKQQGKLFFFKFVNKSSGIVKMATVGYSVVQSITSDHFDLNGCSIRDSRAFVCMYIFIFITLKHKL